MNNHGTLLVLLDMSAAFDTLNHDALINRLFALGFRTKALSLLKSCIQNRFSEVKIGSECSKPSLHTHGVPQGSVLTMKIVQRSTISDHSESAFSVVAPKYWNALPYDIRCLKSLSLFKCKLSTQLLTL